MLDNAAQLELTVMAMPVRPLPLAALRENLCRRLASRLGRVSRPTYPKQCIPFLHEYETVQIQERDAYLQTLQL